ncbi:hypothetical protein JCM11641_008227 [Rhodosporidiobolus odoratus]
MMALQADFIMLARRAGMAERTDAWGARRQPCSSDCRRGECSDVMLASKCHPWQAAEHSSAPPNRAAQRGHRTALCLLAFARSLASLLQFVVAGPSTHKINLDQAANMNSGPPSRRHRSPVSQDDALSQYLRSLPDPIREFLEKPEQIYFVRRFHSSSELSAVHLPPPPVKVSWFSSSGDTFDVPTVRNATEALRRERWLDAQYRRAVMRAIVEVPSSSPTTPTSAPRDSRTTRLRRRVSGKSPADFPELGSPYNSLAHQLRDFCHGEKGDPNNPEEIAGWERLPRLIDNSVHLIPFDALLVDFRSQLSRKTRLPHATAAPLLEALANSFTRIIGDTLLSIPTDNHVHEKLQAVKDRENGFCALLQAEFAEALDLYGSLYKQWAKLCQGAVEEVRDVLRAEQALRTETDKDMKAAIRDWQASQPIAGFDHIRTTAADFVRVLPYFLQGAPVLPVDGLYERARGRKRFNPLARNKSGERLQWFK